MCKLDEVENKYLQTQWITCVKCLKWFHYYCIGPQKINTSVPQKIKTYKCTPCNSILKLAQQPTLSTSISVSENTDKPNQHFQFSEFSLKNIPTKCFLDTYYNYETEIVNFFKNLISEKKMVFFDERFKCFPVEILTNDQQLEAVEFLSSKLKKFITSTGPNDANKLIWEFILPKWCVFVLMKKFHFSNENELFENIAQIKNIEFEAEYELEFQSD